jgi:hypothetical protein
MTSSPLPQARKKKRKKCSTDAEISPDCRDNIQEQLKIEHDVTNGALQALRVSARELCRMHLLSDIVVQLSQPPMSFAGAFLQHQWIADHCAVI